MEFKNYKKILAFLAFLIFSLTGFSQNISEKRNALINSLSSELKGEFIKLEMESKKAKDLLKKSNKSPKDYSNKNKSISNQVVVINKKKQSQNDKRDRGEVVKRKQQSSLNNHLISMREDVKKFVSQLDETQKEKWCEYIEVNGVKCSL